MRAGPGGLSGIRWEVLQVTYANGDVERFHEATEAQLGDRNSQTLQVLTRQDIGQRVVATLALVNVRKWAWVDADSPIRPPVDLSWLSGGAAEQPEGSDR